MATMNPFDLLGDDDNDDPSQLIAKKAAMAPTTAPPQQQPKQQPAKQQQQQQQQQAKLPSKPAPPAQAVREAKSEGRGGGRGGGRGFGGRGGGRGSSGFNRDRSNNENSFTNNGVQAGYGVPEEGEVEKPSERRAGYGGPRGGFRGRRGGFNNGEAGDGERPRRIFERRSGTGRGNELKREGSGRGNWGTPTDELSPESEQQDNAAEKSTEKQPGEEEPVDASKENPATESEEKEPEEKEMTLDEYQKVLEEKRKALLSMKSEERKVDLDKDFESMMQLSNKKSNDDVFIKLGSDKDKRKELVDKDDKAKKSVTIHEFLKPAEGERYYSPGGRGRGRGRGSRGGYSGGSTNVSAPSIEDPGEFPSLGK